MKDVLDQQRNSTWRLFLTAHTQLIAQIEEELAQAGLPSLEWYDVLFVLTETPNHRLRLSELADKVLLSRSNITRLVDRLEQAGLLCRQSCPTDRRGSFAVLTEAGLQMREKMWSVYSRSIAKYFGDHLTDLEVTTLAAILQKLLVSSSYVAR